MPLTVADFIAEELSRRGVRHVFGVGGANIEDLFAAVQRWRPRMQVVLGKHEHAAGTAADAYARLGGGLGVVMTTSGGGAMNLVHALAEARASRVPILALVGEPPSALSGRGAFQDTSGRGGAIDAAAVFRGVSTFCARLERAEDLPELFETALAAAFAQPGPAVLLLAKDRQTAEISPNVRRCSERLVAQVPVPDPAALQRAAELLATGCVVIVAGDGVARAGAVEELGRLSRALDAEVSVAPDGRDAFDNRGECFLGVAGAMGHLAVARALENAEVCLVVGTRLPLLARQGLERLLEGKALVSVNAERPFVSPTRSVHLGGDLRENLRALLVQMSERVPVRRGPPSPTAPVAASSPVGAVSSERVLAAVESVLAEGSVVLVDAGNTGAHAVHCLRAPRGGRWLIAMGMAGMGFSFGAAVGAALATGRRCTVLAGDGAFYMHGLEIHTAIEHALPITYVIFNNRAHGMCLVRERLLLGEESGYNGFRPAHIGAGLSAMFPGLPACDCTTLQEVSEALARAATSLGPSVICAELSEIEVPPFAAFQQAVAESAAGQSGTPELRGRRQ